MSNRPHTNLSIIEAVETLSSIADLELDKGVGVAKQHEIVFDNEKVTYKTVHWLHQQDASATVSLVRETFRVILHYLKQFYRKEYGYVTDPKTVEGIKTIMVLVGEAAKKLDKYTAVFHLSQQQSVTELKEYKQLQDFYLSKIARKIDEGVLGKWILGLSVVKLPKPKTKLSKQVAPSQPIVDQKEETVHVFVDLETVKKDSEYELFFIRKEDGSRFFSPRLLRNIKLVCDFGDYFGEHAGGDPFVHIDHWVDRIYHLSARDILKSIGSSRVEHFFHDIRKFKDHEIVSIMSQALMALLLSSHSNNLSRNNPVKNCKEYFEDFQVFLRDAMRTRSYQKWIAYPPKSTNTLALDLLDLIHAISGAIYNDLKGLEEMVSIIHVLIQDANKDISSEHLKEAEFSKRIWNRIASDYVAMSKLMKRHSNGPLIKVLDTLENSSFHVFDPLMQGNIPCQLYDLYTNEKRIKNLRFATPVCQDIINKAYVNEEFKGFLREYTIKQHKHLLMNLQDRTSWMGHARSIVLEDLQHQDAFKDSLCVVTLAIDTDFYYQLAPYHQTNHATTFIDQFKEHLKGEGSGFYFPPSINQEELFDFIDNTVEGIHRVFFSNKNVLLREHRLDFIEIFYLFLQLKLIDMVKPDSFSFTCKDGIDIDIPYSSELFLLLKFLTNEKWNENDADILNFMLYAPAIIIRERLILSERFNRMLSAIRTMENAQYEFGREYFPIIIQEAFFSFFNTSLLNSKVLLPG